MAKLFALPLIGLSLIFLTSCGEPMSPGVDFNTSAGTDNPPKDGDDSEDPGDSGPDNPAGPEDPEEPGEPSFLPSDLASLSLWLKSTEHQGILGDGYAVGQSGVSALLNLAQGDISQVIMAGAPATYSRESVSVTPSILLCGAKAAGCASSFYDTGAQLKLSNSYRTHSLLHGTDAVLPACNTCSGSFTITALVRRTSPGANMLLSNKDGNNSVGPYLGWSQEKELVFSTNGREGSNNIKVSIAGIPSGLELVTAVYSRRNGIKIYWQGNLAGFELLKTIGASTTSTVMPTLGHREAPISQKLHLYEYLEFQKDLSPSDVCDIHSYLNESYNLNLTLTCKSM